MKVPPKYSPARRDTYHIGDVAERTIEGLFENLHRMPVRNPGYDYLQRDTGKKIEVKSSTMRENGWTFQVRYNKIPDIFVFLAFGIKSELVPMRIWVIPGSKINHRAAIRIVDNVVGLDKWHVYERSINELNTIEPFGSDENTRTAPTGVECVACAFKWLPRTVKPKKCPKCGTRKWNDKRSENAKRGKK